MSRNLTDLNLTEEDLIIFNAPVYRSGGSGDTYPLQTPIKVKDVSEQALSFSYYWSKIVDTENKLIEETRENRRNRKASKSE